MEVVRSMRRSILTFEIVALAFSAGTSYASPAPAPDRPQFTSSQIRQMTRDAKTPEQFTELADFYQTRRRMYVRLASEEMAEWTRRNTILTPLSEKWPTPSDSARNLYEYYLHQAAKSAALANRYSRLGDNAEDRMSQATQIDYSTASH